MSSVAENDGLLILAAEECTAEDFPSYHYFSAYEDRLIRRLVAHGPVLLRGSRGSGKSALMIEAANRMREAPMSEHVVGVYLSLRHLPLLNSTGHQYASILLELLLGSL